MATPSTSPALFWAQKVVAVPRSATMAGMGTRASAPSAPASMSAPTGSFVSTLKLMLDVPSTTGSLPVTEKRACRTASVRAGTTLDSAHPSHRPTPKGASTFASAAAQLPAVQPRSVGVSAEKAGLPSSQPAMFSRVLPISTKRTILFPPGSLFVFSIPRHPPLRKNKAAYGGIGINRSSHDKRGGYKTCLC